MKIEPSYYAIIPANVRYDKDLAPNAKLLYGEITSLCNQKGYCYAQNSYFSDLYGVSKTSISKWISSLINKGYIRSVINYKEGTKEILSRYLTIVITPIEEKLNTPIEKKLKDNTTSINNTINNKISFDDFWNLYDKKVSRDNSEKKWNRLSDKDRELIMQFIPKYKVHQPDKKFRKDPLTFFNNKTWLDEIENTTVKKTSLTMF